jgi:acetoin:2,6-dichlorophenolindophenol oxidoreductase subunit beta
LQKKANFQMVRNYTKMSINNKSRLLTYSQAILEGTSQEMDRDDRVFVMGQGVDDPKGTVGTTTGLHDKFGSNRSFDVPIAEDGMLGVAIGAALAGLRPINVHIRFDFILLCMNQLINMAAKSHYMFGGSVHVPLVIRGAIGRSWGQGAQHSQAFHSYFMHIPGLKVVAPALASDAKGAIIAAIRDENPVIFVEHRMLYELKDHVPKQLYVAEVGKARVVQSGDDITIVAISHMLIEALRACKHLEEQGISVELIDPIWLSPLDIDTIVSSVEKTGRLLVVDVAWLPCGAGAEIAMQVIERTQGKKCIQVERSGFSFTPCPTTKPLENLFYPNSLTISSQAYSMVNPTLDVWIPEGDEADEISNFKGPF